MADRRIKVNMKIQRIQVGGLVLCLASIASASTVNYLPDVTGTTAVASAITAPANGASMAGEISVSINGGPAVLWETNVGACTSGILCGEATGAISGGTWTLLEVADTGAQGNPNLPETTAVNAWTLTNTSTTTAITSVVINGNLTTATAGVTNNSCFGTTLPGNCVNGIVFDRDLASNTTTTSTPTESDGQSGTPNGLGGITYTEKTSSEVGGPYTVGVTYSNIVALAWPVNVGCGGAAFSGNSTVSGCGDEWATLGFSFTGGNAFEATGATAAQWAFFQDTDTAVAPEPLTMALTGLGLLALAGVRKYRASRFSN